MYKRIHTFIHAFSFQVDGNFNNITLGYGAYVSHYVSGLGMVLSAVTKQVSV